MLDIEIQYFYFTFIHLYFTVSLMHFLFKKAQSQNKSWRCIAHAMSCIFSWSVWKAFIKHTCTHTQSHKNILACLHTQKGKKGHVLPFSCTLVELGWMKRNSDTIEKGTLSTQCIHRQKEEEKDNSITFYVASRTTTKL